MASDIAYFVQFPHPRDEPPARGFIWVPVTQSRHHRDEAIPRGRVMPWNTGSHCRKFLISAGRYIDDRHDVRAGELLFWGEWEPPSDIVTTWRAGGRLPRALHRPSWFRPPVEASRQNTDPWVWGDCMLYSNCKQARVDSLQRLTRGSVVCFGSTFGDDFCVDTVLVIASAEPWDPADHDGIDADEAFQVCTAASLAAGDGCSPDTGLALYRGATPEDPVDGMYSFVPAMPATTPYPRFARPPVRLPGLINTKSTRSPRGSARPLAASTARQAWASVRRQVLDAGLTLAVHLDTPPVKTGEIMVSAETGWIRC